MVAEDVRKELEEVREILGWLLECPASDEVRAVWAEFAAVKIRAAADRLNHRAQRKAPGPR